MKFGVPNGGLMLPSTSLGMRMSKLPANEAWRREQYRYLQGYRSACLRGRDTPPASLGPFRFALT